MDAWNLDSAVRVSISVKLGLEIFGVVCTLLAIYTRILIFFVQRKHAHRPKDEASMLALCNLARKNDKTKYEVDIDRLKDEHKEHLENAKRDGYDEGRKEGHEKGYEAGKIDATRDFRLEFADFLNDEASRIRGQVDVVDKLDLPEITTPIPPPSLPRPVLKVSLPYPSGSGEPYNPPMR